MESSDQLEELPSQQSPQHKNEQQPTSHHGHSHHQQQYPEQHPAQPQPRHHHGHSLSLASQTHLLTQLPPAPSLLPRTANSTPMSSPGLFSPTGPRHLAAALAPTSVSERNTPGPAFDSPFLHPLQTHKVRETHKALIDSDNITGRKLINQYEVIEEIGRGMHGKVKLARNLETGDNVAIKIIPRFSKKRRLGKVTAMSPQDKTKKEIAILKKIRHANVVALLEVIDDPELKKIYMVLEHVELGEIIWRKKGLPHVCQYERRRIEREMRGEPPTVEEQKYDEILEQRQALKELKRARMAQKYAGPFDYWSHEYGAGEDAHSAGQQSRVPSKDDFSNYDGSRSTPGSRSVSRAPSRSQSEVSMGIAPAELDEGVDWEDDLETPGPLRSNPNSTTALDGARFGIYAEQSLRGRSPSMADSIISHMSSIDFNYHQHDAFADDFSYVPCFTFDQARSAFRDTVLGLEYLHYQGVVHRDIKPANLLWSRDHRVKISDFGVSYFGRPIRDGEVDETVSESEAQDFDDDLELAKTVGTPAFFAPELCYTDLDQEQPKVSEQIDVWSLGVTLYCLVFARIPFLAEDEFQMFRKIATDEVYIPRRRLRPVDPSTSPSTTSLYKRQNTLPYRDDNDLEYEDVDNLLYDLLRLMLIKNPEKRIRLRDIKRHPWVVQGMQNPIGWLDDTDPARPTSGRRIQVDDRDVSDAVVPLTLLERARSIVKKTVGKVMHPLVERSDSRTRRRATSSAASSAGDSMLNHAPQTLYHRTSDRRRSIRPDDYFADAVSESPTSMHPHPFGYDPKSEAEPVAYDPMATVLPPLEKSSDHSRRSSAEIFKDSPSRGSSRQGHRAETLQERLMAHIAHSHGSGTVPALHTTPSTPVREELSSQTRVPGADQVRSPRSIESLRDEPSRSRSVDRGLFSSSDKRAHAQVGITNAIVPGNIQAPRHPRSVRSIDLSKAKLSPQSASPMSSSPRTVSSPKPQNYLEQVPDAKSPPPRNYNTSNAESFARAKEVLWRKEQLQMSESPPTFGESDPVRIPCPPSPDDDWSAQAGVPSRGDTMTTAKSSSTDSVDVLGTPLTSPSETTSPISAYPPGKNTSERMLVFQSDPSLPALLSGASSVSADMEAELLGRPGVVSGNPSLLETTDSLTPPALAKEPAGGFPIYEVFDHTSAIDNGSLNVHVRGSNGRAASPRPASRSTVHNNDDDDDGSDSSDDGILLMAKSKKKKGLSATNSPRAPIRRDTNISTTSTETARMVPRDEETKLVDG